LIALLGAALVLGLGAWLFTHLGWLRLQSQLAAQIGYEDQRARAGDVSAVLALQAPGEPDWRDQVMARVRLGLAAPLPAGDLLPAVAAPRLARVDPLGGDLFAATVARDYVDSAGQTYSFDLTQRYRNLAPGEWERLPPDTSALNTTSLFQGQRLSVTVPTADLPWLGPALLMADDLVVGACADWGDACPAGLRLAASFGAAQELNDPSKTAQRTGVQLNAPTNAPGGYPRIFDLPVDTAAGMGSVGWPVYTLPAPLLAGRPHDAAAQAALSRSISVQLLGLFAGEVSASGRANGDYFLDALVARAEVRHLGASAAPQSLAPQDYVPLKLLWQLAGTYRSAGGWRTDLAARREAFDFLNFALAGQPATADGKLLRSLFWGGGNGVDDWLARELGPQALTLPAAWTQQTLAAFANRAVTDWQQYDGLVLGCDSGLYQVQGGAPKLVMSSPQSAQLVMSIQWVSPDGRYLSLDFQTRVPPEPNSSPRMWDELWVVDLVSGVESPVATGSPVIVYGWSATDDLIYALHNPLNNQTDSLDALQLRAYHPGDRASRVLIPDRVNASASGAGIWSADHSALLLTLDEEQSPGSFRPVLGLLSFSPAVHVRRLAAIGDWPALSPDGNQVAFVNSGSPTGASVDGTAAAGLSQLNVLDVTTGSVRRVAVSNYQALPPGPASFYGGLWSPGGNWLAWQAGPPNILLSAPAGGGSVRVWGGSGQQSIELDSFSPDERYLQAWVAGLLGPADQVPGLAALNQYWLFDQQAMAVQPPISGWAYSSVWMPKGHRLVAAGPAGVSALDPATGDTEWLGDWQNCQLRW
jgi:hypothetical protein